VSCSAYDWKAYALGELDSKSRRDAELHAAACLTCRDELAGLRLTLDALSTLREEEIPRRIAFVSDKVFEPRWWQSFLRPSFAAGSLIAAAILVHAFVRPPQMAPVDTAAIQAKIEMQVEAEVSKRVDAAVAKAVALSEQQQSQKTQQLLADTEKHYAEQRKADFAAAAANYEMLSKQLNRFYAVNTGLGVGQ
jgi:hypothetical protein